MIRLIAWKELRALFGAPSTWLILGALQFILAWAYLGRLDAFLQVQSQLALVANAPGASEAVVPGLFRDTLGEIVMLVTPLFTMRLLAEERRNQTLVLLLSAPISSARIVLGKFAGLIAFLWLLILWCGAMAATLRLGTPMDLGLLLSNTLGMLLLAASYAALGLYISSLTTQPVVAAVGALATLSGLWLIERSAPDGYRIWHALAPTGHFRNFNSGLLDSSDIAYFVLFCAFFLALTIRRLDDSRSYG